MSKAGTVNWRKEGNIAVITLNQPKTLNAMSLEDYAKLSNILRDIAQLQDISITVLTGTGRFFSAGADLESRPPPVDLPDKHSVRGDLLRRYAMLSLDLTRSFYTHPKILVAALNGPAVGLSAAPLGFCDFIYATPHTYLLVPFSSLGLIMEGGSSIGLVQRMGMTKANEALIMSKKISCEELMQCGFLNKVFEASDNASNANFLDQVIKEIQDRLGNHLNQRSMLQIKALIRKPYQDVYATQGVLEAMTGVDQLMTGAPTEEFEKIFQGSKRHKL